jgi:hypothetical protein
MKRNLADLFNYLDHQNLQLQIDITKELIHYWEKSNGWERLFAETNCFNDWKRYYSKFIGELTPSKLIIQKAKRKIVERYQKSLYSDIEAIRTLIEAELLRFNKKKLYYRTDFKTANALYFPVKFIAGHHKGEFIKFDIKSCFYSIYSRIGIDANILATIDHEKKIIDVKACGQGVITTKNSQLIRNLADQKTLRNSVYGLTRYCFAMYLYPDGRIEKRYIRTNLQNLDLLVIIASLLHSIVYPYRDYIIYWNIDGGIIRSDMFEKMKKEIEDLGFEIKLIEQNEEVEILGYGSYRIGNFYTGHYENNIKAKQKNKENIYYVNNAEKIKAWFRRLRYGKENS